MNNDLTKEQWQAIAEKMEEYLSMACSAYHTIEDCFKCPIPCEMDISWIDLAKKELGYE